MSTAERLNPISIDDYLAGEVVSRVKHEYVAGVVYAMVGARNVHNLIASNALVTLGMQLRGKRCRPFNSDTKVRIRLPSHTRFYYPDAMVVCQPNPQTDTFQDAPVVLIEVVSKGTRRFDEGEKRDAYLAIPSLATYILLEQESPAAVVYERGEQGFSARVYREPTSIIPLQEIDAELRFADVYDGVEFSTEPDESEA